MTLYVGLSVTHSGFLESGPSGIGYRWDSKRQTAFYFYGNKSTNSERVLSEEVGF